MFPSLHSGMNVLRKGKNSIINPRAMAIHLDHPLPPPLTLNHPILSKLETNPNPTQFNQILTQTITTGLFHNTFAATRLLKFSPTLPLTTLLFSQIKHPDLFSYNLLIKSNSQSPHPLDSIPLYRELLHLGLLPNEYTFCFLLDCCSKCVALREGQQVHCHLIKHGMHFNTFSSTSLVHMYGDCAETLDASRAFDQMRLRSNASWGAMIDAFVSNGSAVDGLKLFVKMTTTLGVRPGNAALVGVVCACAELGDLVIGKTVHGFIVINGFELSVTLGTSLVDMYSKCGVVDMATEVFSVMPERNVASWNSMIRGLGMNGLGARAVELFREMDAKPNGVTFLGLLQACAHAGLVENGARYFAQMSGTYGVEPNIKHYGCMVDLYARAGRVDEAMEVVSSMHVKPDAVIWGALLGGCRAYGCLESEKVVAAKVIKMSPLDECGYLVLSDSFARERRWDDVVAVRKMMSEMEIRKVSGWSFIPN